MLRKAKNICHNLNAGLANLYYQYPAKNLKIIGITGTDGKTTTATIIYHILKTSGLKVGLVSTVAAYINKKEIETGLHVTSPNPWVLQRLIKKMVSNKCEYLVLEVTSHGLDQNRVLGIDFEIGVLTNITREHLDYHKTKRNYMLAKAKLFKKSKIAILNSNYPEFIELIKQMKSNTGLITYSAKTIQQHLMINVVKKFPEKYNIENLSAAYMVCKKLNISDNYFLKSLKTFKGIPGRMQRIENERGLNIYIDFAHTPNALKNVLTELSKRKRNGSNLVCVFGCAGERDKGKRPMMGKIAGELADIIILTAEDPRYESESDIISQIAKGITNEKVHVFKIEDRGEAIYESINKMSKKNDTIVICGKGHEKSMCYKDKEYMWSDQEAVLSALNNKIFKLERIYG